MEQKIFSKMKTEQTQPIEKTFYDYLKFLEKKEENREYQREYREETRILRRKVRHKSDLISLSFILLIWGFIMIIAIF